MTDTITLRVRLHEAWDDISVTVAPQSTIADVKQRVLDIAGEEAPASEFVVKFRGVDLRDEGAAVVEARIPDGAALIVTHRRRRAVR